MAKKIPSSGIPENTVLNSRTNQSVKRPNETIGIKPNSGKLTLLSRRVFHMLIYFIQEDGNKEIYSRSLMSFMEHIEYTSNNTAILKETLLSLMNSTVEWNSDIIGDDDNSWNSETASNLVSEVTIIQKGKGTEVNVEWSFAPKLREKLLDPKFYTRFAQYYFHFRSTSSLSLFEIIERYKTNPSRKTNKEPWEWWLPRITGNSVENCEYKYFKRDVLRPAVAEINQIVTEYEIELLEHRDGGGRKVTSLQFIIHFKKQQQQNLEINVPPPINTELIDRMIRMGINETEAKRIFIDNSEDLIARTIIHTEQRANNSTLAVLNSKAGYFKNALQHKYVDAVALNKPLEAKQISHPNLPTAGEKYSVHLQSKASSYFEDLSESAKQSFIQNYLDTNKIASVVSGYKKSGFKSTIFSKSFFSWLAIHLWGEPGEEEIQIFNSNSFAEE